MVAHFSGHFCIRTNTEKEPFLLDLNSVIKIATELFLWFNFYKEKFSIAFVDLWFSSWFKLTWALIIFQMFLKSILLLGGSRQAAFFIEWKSQYRVEEIGNEIVI